MSGSSLRALEISGSQLVRDYLHEHSRVAPFFNGSPFQLDSFRHKQFEVQARFGSAQREACARFLTPTSAAAQDRLAAWVRAGGIVVTTGQQAGFLTGPLFTIYKAFSTLRLARHLEGALAVPVLPVFWIASDDHDWAEVNHTVLLDRLGRPFRIELPSGDPRPLPMSERILPAGIENIFDDISQRLSGQYYSDEYIKRIIDSYAAGRTVAGAFRDLLLRVLAPFDLYVVDAADPELKAVSQWVVREALESAVEHERVIGERTREVVDRGYGPQVSGVARATNVFRHGEGGRERLFRVGEKLGVRGSRLLFERGELLEELAETPSRFSPNVLLRPVVESAVLPTVAYVGGPAEIGYFAQASALFGCFGMEPPVVVPRFSGVVVEPEIERLMAKLDLSHGDIARSREELVERVARREVPPQAAKAIERIRKGLVESYRRLLEEAAEVDPTLSGSLGAVRNRSLAEVVRAERKIVRAIKRREGVALGQVARVLDALRPFGIPQERALNVLTPLGRSGGAFLEEVEAVIERDWRLPEASDHSAGAPRATEVRSEHGD